MHCSRNLPAGETDLARRRQNSSPVTVTALNFATGRLYFIAFRHGAVGRMRTAGVAKELRKVVAGHSAAEDTHDKYGDIKNDFSIADRKRAIDALKFENVLDYSRLKELRPALLTLHTTLMRTHTRNRRK